MAKFNLVLVFIFFLPFSSFAAGAKLDRLHASGYLGEKNIEHYADRYQPLILQDIYRGKIVFKDEVFFQNFFRPYLFQEEKTYSDFLRSELTGSLSCPNHYLSEHFEDLRYSYRLITLSYLLEGIWHFKLMSDHLGIKRVCEFNLKEWVKSCHPKTSSMKKLVSRLEEYNPRYEESISPDYKKADWIRDLKGGNPKWYSHYRLKKQCGSKCEEDLSVAFRSACESDTSLMTLICSEKDEIYGLSQNRDAYYLLGISNIINTYNNNGEAMGCLQRFSEVMAHKEVRYDVLNVLFPSLQNFLRTRYQERFLQGRIFFFGSGKEFEDKGLKDIYVKEQPLKIETAQVTSHQPTKGSVKKAGSLKEETTAIVVKTTPIEKKTPLKEVSKPIKSAFLQAAEIRSSQDMEVVEVDMLKLKYDYVFSLNMINSLSDRLKNFMTREALIEMTSYDKLGSKEAPVPLLFVKYMIDMQEHQGLWNILAIVGDRFYVSNEIDVSFNPKPELIKLVNNESTERQWQIFILRSN